MPSKPHVYRPPHLGSVEVAQHRYEVERGSARQRGYDARWDKASALFKVANPLCLGCAAVGRVTATTVVDHIEPHLGDMVKFWDDSMWQPSCAWHHDVVKQRLEGLYARGQLGLSDLRLDSVAAIALTTALDP